MIKETLEDKTYRLFSKAVVAAGLPLDAYEAYEPEVRQECADAIRARSEL